MLAASAVPVERDGYQLGLTQEQGRGPGSTAWGDVSMAARMVPKQQKGRHHDRSMIWRERECRAETEEKSMQLLTEQKAAEVLNCTIAALRRWRRERRGPRFVKLGRLIRYNLSDIEAFVEQSTQAVVQQGRRLSAMPGRNQ